MFRWCRGAYGSQFRGDSLDILVGLEEMEFFVQEHKIVVELSSELEESRDVSFLGVEVSGDLGNFSPLLGTEVLKRWKLSFLSLDLGFVVSANLKLVSLKMKFRGK